MLKREDIKNGTIVFNTSDDFYGYLQDVGNARVKGDRGSSSTPDDEPSYTVVDLITGEEHDGICEHSGYNDQLKVSSPKDVDIYLAIKEADSLEKLAKAKKNYSKIQDAINRFDKMKKEM